MPQPLVCAIMLTKDRPEMAARAVRCFREQHCASLFIVNSGSSPMNLHESNIEEYYVPFWKDKTIGELRNIANGTAGDWFTGMRHQAQPDILIHWDDDDWSHPNRISEQVAHLQSSGADVVGYNQMLFFRHARGPSDVDPMERLMPVYPSETWLYHNVRQDLCPGTSLCYWRKTWERKPFPDTSEAEDRKFCMGLNCAAVTGLRAWDVMGPSGEDAQPRIIASIHGGNTMNYNFETMQAGWETNWKRPPHFDAYCRERMAL